MVGNNVWITYAVFNPGVHGINHATRSQDEEECSHLNQVGVEPKLDGFREQNGSDQFAFARHEPLVSSPRIGN